MEDLRKEQLEALQVMLDYIPKLRKGMETVAKELSGERLADTYEYLKKVIEGLNWVIEVYNGTHSLFNSESHILEKDTINKASMEFSTAYKNNDALTEAKLLQGDLLSFVSEFEKTAKSIVA